MPIDVRVASTMAGRCGMERSGLPNDGLASDDGRRDKQQMN